MTTAEALARAMGKQLAVDPVGAIDLAAASDVERELHNLGFRLIPIRHRGDVASEATDWERRRMAAAEAMD